MRHIRIVVLSCLIFFVNANISSAVDVWDCNEFLDAYSSPSGDNEIVIEQDIYLDDSIGCPGKKDIVVKGNEHSLNGNNSSGMELSNGDTLTAESLKGKNFHSQVGAVVNNQRGYLKELNGEYTDNTADDEGGVLFNNSYTGSVNGNFENNTAYKNGGAIYNNTDCSIDNITGNFTNNKAVGNMGGAIFNHGNIGNINAKFSGNKTEESDGGAIMNSGRIDSIKGEFTNNYAEGNGGAINNSGTIENLNADFTENRAKGDHYPEFFKGGGAVMNFGSINKLSGKFENNKVEGNGGAICNCYGNINIVSDENEVLFRGNEDTTGYNAIYNDSGVINLEAKDYDIVFDDGITGGNTIDNINSVININKESNGNVVLNNNVSDNIVNMYNGTLKFGKAQQNDTVSYGNFTNNVNFNFYGGKIDLINDNVQNTNLGNLSLYNDLEITLDCDFENLKSDTLSVDSFVPNGYHINISDMNIMTPTARRRFCICPFNDELSDTIKRLLSESVLYKEGIIDTPIYKYHTYYDIKNGQIWFERMETGNNFNPSVMAASVGAQLGGYLTQLNSYEEAFRKMDLYMLMPFSKRLTYKYRNKYADAVLTSSVTEYKGDYLWLRPYTTLEKVNLKNGPKVSNTAYGSFFGGETDIIELKHGMDFVWGLYGGYNGSNQKYSDVEIYQNGATLGAVSMLYKNNFFSGLTANISANGCEAQTMYGHEAFSMLMGGIASKSGYNFEFNDGKFIIQPNYLMSYTFVNTFDYNNKANVKISSDVLNAIQIAPGIQIAWNLKYSIQPYFSAHMVWNLIDKSRFSANDTALPQLSIKPFVMYGFGIRKLFGERTCGYYQNYITQGGRNGIGFQFGIRYKFGL